jgi:hypothetical protein
MLIKWYEAPMELETFLIPTQYFNCRLPILSNPTCTSQVLTEKYPKCFQKDSKKWDRICHNDRIDSIRIYKHPFGVVWHSVFRTARPQRYLQGTATLARPLPCHSLSSPTSRTQQQGQMSIASRHGSRQERIVVVRGQDQT